MNMLDRLKTLNEGIAREWFVPAANDAFDDMDVMICMPKGQLLSFQTHPGLTREEAKQMARLIVAMRNALPKLIRIAEAAKRYAEDHPGNVSEGSYDDVLDALSDLDKETT